MTVVLTMHTTVLSQTLHGSTVYCVRSCGISTHDCKFHDLTHACALSHTHWFDCVLCDIKSNVLPTDCINHHLCPAVSLVSVHVVP